MTIGAKEIKIDLCDFHVKTTDPKEVCPGYTFAEHLLFPARACSVPGCENAGYTTLIGLQLPDAVGELPREVNIGVNETFLEASELLSTGKALERLTYYLKTRIVPSSHRPFLSGRLTRHYALLVLAKLKINPDTFLGDREIHQILSELGMYPEDMND